MGLFRGADAIRLEQLPRRPDVDHVYFAEPLLSFRIREPGLRGDERGGVIGPHARPQWLAGVAVEAGGDVDGEDFHAVLSSLIDPSDRITPERFTDWTGQPGS